jgi:hypothetical protein
MGCGDTSNRAFVLKGGPLRGTQSLAAALTFLAAGEDVDFLLQEH